MSLLRDGSRVTGAVVRDEETGRTFDVRASAVIVCAGVWSDLVHEASGVRAGYQVRMSKGVHLVMPRLGDPVEPSRVESVEPWWRAVAAQAHGGTHQEEPATEAPELAAAVEWPAD